MALINCDRCGKVYNADNALAEEKLCPDCVMEDGKDLKKVTDYLRKFPLANVMEVYQNTKVQQSQIFRFIKAGSLKMRKPVEEFKCRICGAEIKTGTICLKCRGRIDKGFNR